MRPVRAIHPSRRRCAAPQDEVGRSDGGLRRKAPLPTLRNRFMLSLDRQQTGRLLMAKQKAVSRTAAQTAVKKKWSGHKAAAKSSARKTVKSKARGLPAVKSKAAKDGEQGEGSQAENAAEAAHRHQPSPRRRFQAGRPAHLCQVSRPRHRGCQPRPGAGPCDPADRPVQSGGSFKAALPRRRIPDGLRAQGLGEDLPGRPGRDADESKAAPGLSRRASSI